MKGVNIEFTDDDSFWITTRGKKNEEIKLRLDIRVFPGLEATSQKVGEGRQEPNMLPYLPPPLGRIQFSLNPFKMLSQLASKEFLAKFYTLCCCLICVAGLIAMAPMILSNFVSLIVAKMVGMQ
jgi:hypothetical protein